MSPGRELDALIAEKVMGLNVIEEWVFETRSAACPDGNYGCLVMHYEQVPIKPKSYSTAISAAWEVVEKLSSGDLSGYGNRPIELCLKNYTKHPVWCEFWLTDDNAGDDESVWIAQGETAPHAICLAALKAVGEEI